MNNYDLTVGDGVFGDDQNPSGMFNYVQRNEPTVGMAVGGDVESQLRRVLDPEPMELAPEFAPQQAVDAAFDLALNKQAPQPADVIQNLQQAGAQEAPSNSLFDNRIAQPFSLTSKAQDVTSGTQSAGVTNTSSAPQQPAASTITTAPKAGQPFSLPSIVDWANKNIATQLGNTIDYSLYTAQDEGAPQTPIHGYGDYLITAIGSPKYETVLETGPDGTPQEVKKRVSDGITGYSIEGFKGKTDTGVDYIARFDVDTSGNIQQSVVRYQTGKDSGIDVGYDANGNITFSSSYDKSERWRKPTALALSAIGSAFGLPALGNLISGGALTGTSAAMLGGAALSGANAAVLGAEGSDILKSAAVGAASAGAGALADTASKAAGSFVTNLFPETAAWDTVSSLAGDVAAGAVKGGISALPGAIATGSGSGVLTGGLMGGLGGAFSNLTEGLTSYGIKPSQIQAGINIARGLQSGNTSAILNSLGGLLDSKNVDIAGKAIVAFNAISSGNPIKAAAAIVQLSNSVNTSSSKTSKSTPSSQTTSQTDIDNLNNVFASLGSDEKETFAELTDEEAENLLSLLDKPPTQEGQDQVVISGSKIPVGDQFLDSLLSENYFTATPKPLTQSVSVTGKYMTNASEPGYLYDPTDVTAPSERVPVTGERLKYLTSTGSSAYLDKPADPVLQSVSITGKLLPPELIELEGIDIPEPFVPKEVPKAEEIKTPPKAPITIPKAPPSLRQTAPQQALAGRQEELTSLGALPLFESVFYEQRMREQQLADLLEQEENQDPYEVLMRMAERNPEVAVDELMRIIEGA